MNDLRTLIRTDVAILRNTRAIIALACCNAREVQIDRTADGGFVTDAGIAVEHIDAALDALDEAIATLEVHVNPDADPEPHGTRDTFVPHPTNQRIAPRNPELSPICPSCHHDLELDGDMRCVRCGAQ
mgnify:CR=1 FL=1